MLERLPEPELMLDADQARAYAEADFSEPHNHFVQLLGEHLVLPASPMLAMDLGCGPADISIRMAKRYPQLLIHGVDGSAAMLDWGHNLIRQQALEQRITLFHCTLPTDTLHDRQYELVFSNSLLHHLHDPRVLWQTVQQLTQSGSQVFIMDLMRPASREQAQALVVEHAGKEPEVLRRDFFNSLLAAFTVEEVSTQLRLARLPLQVKAVSDRHLIVWGEL